MNSIATLPAKETVMKLSRSAILFGVVVLLTGGCATFLGGPTQVLVVNANVDGAEVRLNDILLGTTPLTVAVERGKVGALRITADGYKPYTAALNKKITSLFWVNLLTGGPIGSSTDYSTGAMYEYEPSTFMISLQPEEVGFEESQEWMRIEALRGLVLLNNEAIVSDLANGNGEHLDLLFDVLSVDPRNRSEAVDRWRAGYEASNTALEFADFMLAELN